MGDACSCTHVHVAVMLYDTAGFVAVEAILCEISDLAHNLDKLSLQSMTDLMSLFFTLFNRPNNNKITNNWAKESQ